MTRNDRLRRLADSSARNGPSVLVSSDKELAALFCWLVKNASVVEFGSWKGAWTDQDEESLEDCIRRIQEIYKE